MHALLGVLVALFVAGLTTCVVYIAEESEW